MQRRAGQRQIADGINRLVAHELVGEAHTFGIEDSVLRNDDRVFERGAERIAGAPQFRYVAHEAESARPGQIIAKHTRRNIDAERLPSNQRIIELDLSFDSQAARVWPQLAVTAVLANAYRLEHLNVPARRRLNDDTNLIDRGDERGGATVHDRDFGAVDLDDGVIDPESA